MKLIDVIVRECDVVCRQSGVESNIHRSLRNFFYGCGVEPEPIGDSGVSSRVYGRRDVLLPPRAPQRPCANLLELRRGSPFYQFFNGEVFWTIDEILTGEDLKVEGGIMRHCVAGYLHACVRRQTSIWSMKVTQGQRKQRLLTIEVNPETREIRQVKGKRNSAPSESGMAILQR